MNELPPDGLESDEDHSLAVTRICHLLVLKREGKIEAAAQSLVVAVLALDPEVRLTSAKDFQDAIQVYFNLRISEALLSSAIEVHVTDGYLLVAADGKFRLSALAAAEVLSRTQDAMRLEGAVRDAWLSGLPDHLTAIRAQSGLDLWKALRAYLTKAFLRHGAQTAFLLQASPSTDLQGRARGSADLDKILSAYAPGVSIDEAREAVACFLQPSSAEQSRYLAQLLDGAFTIFALAIDEATSHFLQENLPHLRLFMDTNLIFGVLGLHTNPADDAAKELLHIIVTQSLPFDLAYHVETERELRDTLATAIERLKERRWQQAMSRAILAAASLDLVTGLERLYHAANAEKPTDAGIFVRRFENVGRLLAEQGAKVYRPPPDSDYSVEEKGKAVAEYQAYLDKRVRLRTKSYRAITHDVVLLHAVDRLASQRGSGSILESGTLVITQDYSLYGYARHQELSAGRPSHVVLASHLLQLLRPFVETTEDLDRLFVDTCALPELRAFPVDYKQTAAKVITALNAVDGIPAHAAMRILTDEMLLCEVETLDVDSKEFQIQLEASLLRDNDELRSANREVLDEKRALETIVTSQDQLIHDLEDRAKTSALDAQPVISPADPAPPVTDRSAVWRVATSVSTAVALLALAGLGIGMTAGTGWIFVHFRYVLAVVCGSLGIVWFVTDSNERRRWSGAAVVILAALTAFL